jgi:NAD(P)-dependent dehydrogenase (short-subunit alcohol dehydrogenase family)
MDLGIAEQVALITGAGQGIGREIANVLASEGALVVVNDVIEPRADSVAQEVNAAGGKALAVPADVTDPDQVRAMVSRVTEAFGPVDILVNNAGIIPEYYEGKARAKFAEYPFELSRKFIELIFVGNLICTQAVLKPMIERKHGKIVNIISEAARIGEPTLAVYAGAKAAVLAFSKSIAQELGRSCVNVNCIALAATAHEGTKGILDPDGDIDTDPVLARIIKAYPIGKGLGRVGRCSDAAHAVAFLVSDKASFITGQCLSVSGGFTMVS